MMEAVIEGSASAEAKLVFADDTWMYGKPDGPMTEKLPYRPVSNKGVLRAWLAEMLLRAHDGGSLRVAIGRAGELYGPAVESVLGRNLFGAALKGKKARFIGDPNQPLTPTFVEDFAKALIVLGEREEALGEAWHVPTAEPTTGREFVRMIFEECGEDVSVGAAGSGVAKALGLFWPLAREGAEMVYQFERLFVVDSGKYDRAFGGSGSTPYREGIGRTVDWYRRDNQSGGSPRASTTARHVRPEKAATRK
jgi:nucleoside-diphosphate-sugar epimerase